MCARGVALHSYWFFLLRKTCIFSIILAADHVCLESLESGKTYEFRISAGNSLGSGNDLAFIHTMTSNQDLNPVDIIQDHNSDSSDSYFLTWVIPPTTRWRSIQQYQARYRRVSI